MFHPYTKDESSGVLGDFWPILHYKLSSFNHKSTARRKLIRDSATISSCLFFGLVRGPE